MSVPSQPARVFIGSSAEGRDVARHLEAELDAALCEVTRWDVDVFEPGGYTLDSLSTVAAAVDFAVLIASPDDQTFSRGKTTASARDNVVLEYGLFAGALGRQRTYLLATGVIRLPTDVLGVTRLSYVAQSTGRSAVTKAALEVEARVRALGRLQRTTTTPGDVDTVGSALDRELDRLGVNAVAQGWTVKTNSPTTFRLLSPGRKPYTLQKGKPDRTREDLRLFAAQLRAAGLRVNSSVRRPVGESPF